MGMIIYTMKPDNNICGPVAIANALQMPIENVLVDGWNDTFYGNDDDSVWHHEAALKRLGYGIQRKTFIDLLECNFTPGKTLLCMLVNDADPTSYHWFTLYEGTLRGVAVLDGIKASKISISWERIKSGWGIAATAYEINNAPESLSWYKRLWVWLTSVIKFKMWG
jgi:hypothetical protein